VLLLPRIACRSENEIFGCEDSSKSDGGQLARSASLTVTEWEDNEPSPIWRRKTKETNREKQDCG
jgi:hypothetical protein